ncbi:putative ABC transporter permease [Bifidobacterium vespertilionis]|uniref:putative ABC transporter permease n=1 Tax=Bifidobacterium vespertilionis TaxID=2562524 RepID=UPI001BDD8BEE|nr:putative ABC transporter permease [Bifidobacterium vespertilionis]MBT1179779.1 putative ABC transporter permease [Bifidobacterium vespertilionis]
MTNAATNTPASAAIGTSDGPSGNAPDDRHAGPSNNASDNLDAQRLPLLARVYGVLVLIDGVITVLLFALTIVMIVLVGIKVGLDWLPDIEPASLTFILAIVQSIVTFANAVGLVIFGVFILTNRRRHVARWAYALMVPTFLNGLLDLALVGLGPQLLIPLAQQALLVVISVTADPGLREERRLQLTLRLMDERDEYERALARGMVGRDMSGRGYAALDFFNIIWIFFVGCLAGWVIEFFYVGLKTGTWMNRAGMLYGPLSPIYGFGACILTICLNRLYRMNPVLIYLASAVIGGAFEYCSSWFLEVAFGIVSWDYTGQWLSIGGRTSGKYMMFWGLLGLLWIKVALPPLLRLINRIPWKWRYSATLVLFAFLFVDGLMTLMAYDCWYTRAIGLPQDSPAARFFERHYGDAFMQARFPGMTMQPGNAGRV